MRRLLIVLAGLALGPLPAAAQSVVSTGGSFVEASLLAGRPEPGGRLAGLALDLAPGWKTYWRAPGEAGVPPDFDWSGSENVAEVTVLWPAPELFESFGMTTVGYSGAVVLPLAVTAADPERPVSLAGRLRLGVCRDICVFEETEVAAAFAPGEAEGAERVEAALAAVPGAGALEAVSCRVEGAGEARRFTADLRFDRPLAAPVVLLEGPDSVWFHGTRTTAEGPRLHVEAGMGVAEGAPWVARDAIRMTVLAEGFAADVRGCRPAG